ncbi:thiamine transport system ATP-binding protein [Trueperella bonasi]|uniref:Thiamine transport system ATP-binding protein n=1 Tax=Trueperella bonasi TaxID=312286 RepID=A0ABT9NGI6_9ACTO|nr:ABC transporter ATP-binding protein [Trueperella bonasi]MDP9806516.1 thiamine transport system ATP-binding protein [Trueperella bonasi]
MSAVNKVNLEVSAGQTVAILGESGSGKSSLLRAVAGLEQSAGGVHVNGTEVSSLPAHKRNIGMVFQEGMLFPHRNVARNVAYGLEIQGISARERSARVAQMLELVGLGGFENRQISTLSGGQAQRVALARTLAPQPRVVLLDEPLSALDRITRTQLAEDLRDILDEAGATALYVTHDRDEAFTVADQLGVMAAGELVQVGYPEDVIANPVSDVVLRLLAE